MAGSESHPIDTGETTIAVDRRGRGTTGVVAPRLPAVRAEHAPYSKRATWCPTLVLWRDRGPLRSWYADAGGPLTLWRDLADDVRGEAVAGGHLFVEEHPRDTAERLSRLVFPGQ